MILPLLLPSIFCYNHQCFGWHFLSDIITFLEDFLRKYNKILIYKTFCYCFCQEYLEGRQKEQRSNSKEEPVPNNRNAQRMRSWMRFMLGGKTKNPNDTTLLNFIRPWGTLDFHPPPPLFFLRGAQPNGGFNGDSRFSTLQGDKGKSLKFACLFQVEFNFLLKIFFFGVVYDIK